MPGLIPGCLETTHDFHKWTYWIPMLVFESVIVVLAIGKLMEMARARETTPHVMTVIVRDSVMYFGGIFAFMVTNFVIWAAAIVEWANAVV